MKNLLFFIAILSFVGCSKEDDSYCDCGPGPKPDEKLIVELLNSSGQNLLLPYIDNNIPDSSLTFYMIKGNPIKVINLSSFYKTSSFLFENFQQGNEIKYVVLNYPWLLQQSANEKYGSYVIDYNGKFPNDTIYLKYDITPNDKIDRIIEVNVNGIHQETESINDLHRKLVITK